jgi:hypothetical protein
VPELRNEVPSDQELVEYLEASLQPSSFSILADYPNNRDRYPPDHVEALSYLASLPICVEFLSVLKNALCLTLKCLNQLPRTDPFWVNTNRRPTFLRLTEYCDRVLAQDPNDVGALLTITAITAFRTGEFKRGRWAQLWELNAVSVEFIVFGAMFMEMCGAVDSHDLAELVVANRLENRILPELTAAAQRGGKLLAEWVGEVLDQLAILRR